MASALYTLITRVSPFRDVIPHRGYPLFVRSPLRVSPKHDVSPLRKASPLSWRHLIDGVSLIHATHSPACTPAPPGWWPVMSRFLKLLLVTILNPSICNQLNPTYATHGWLSRRIHQQTGKLKPGNHIVKFAVPGPKNYGCRTQDGKVIGQEPVTWQNTSIWVVHTVSLYYFWRCRSNLHTITIPNSQELGLSRYQSGVCARYTYPFLCPCYLFSDNNY